MRTNVLFAFLLTFLTHSLSAQVLDPVKWQTTVETGTGDSEKVIVFIATIDPDWYLYSSDFDPEVGPQVTTFVYEEPEGFELDGEVVPINPKEKFDEIFEGNVTYFKGTGVFRQTVKISGDNNPVANGYIEYQTCSDITGQCIPKEFEFSIPLTGGSEEQNSENNLAQSGESTGGVFSQMDNDETPSDESNNPDKSTIATDQPDSNKAEEEESLWSFLLIAFLAGIAVLITPCVFPILPMTLSMFSHDKSSGHFKAIFYGLSIVIIYTLAGSLVAGLLGADANNEISTHWLPNLIFFLTFFIFALSFFGLFEITLPHSLVNRIDSQADRGGLIGVFFMALTLVVVSFSCTGPIVGSLLVASASGSILQPVLGMFSFGLGMALPLTLLAFSPGLVDRFIRGKSGSWLNAVKVVFGFIELALAFKFLSMIDLVYHWNLLDRDIFLVIWIVIFSLMGFYLLKKIRINEAPAGPGESQNNSIGVGRLLLSIITFTFVLYLIPGLFGAPLKSIAGYLPPMSTQDFNIVRLMREQSGVSNELAVAEEENCETPLYNDFLEIPQGLYGYFDYEQALACSKATGKPIFLDFTGHGCANCREMEESVWSEPDVLKSLKEDFIIVSLYVDERYELPEEQWYESEYDGKVKKTIGKQNADFQITRFGNNAQPFYVLVDGSGTPLTEQPMGYNKDPEAFKKFLSEGLNHYENNNVAAVQ